MADIDPNLIFQDPPTETPDLVFGGGSFTPPKRRVSVLVRVGGVSVQAVGSQPVRAYAAAMLGGVKARAGVYYDNRVTPYLDSRFMTVQQAAISLTSDNGGDWGVSKSSERLGDPLWTTAQSKVSEQGDLSKASLNIDSETAISHTLGDGRTATTRTNMDIAVFVDTARSSKYTKADPQRAFTSSGMQAGIFKVQSRGQDWQGGVSKLIVRGGSIGKGIANQGHNALDSKWVLAGRGMAGAGSPPTPKPKPPTPKPKELVNSHLLFQYPPITGIPALIFGGLSGSVIPTTNTKIVPVRRVYIVINNASLRRVDGNIQLPVMNMSLSLDTDSWTWGFNASLPGSALSNIEPSSSGTPVEVEAMINGVAYRALIEGVSRSREFGKSDIRVQGRGKTALLDSPYAPTMNFANTESRTAQHLMIDALTYNGASIGWSIEWGVQDWVVPAGVFAYQGSYIGALNQIAAAAGGYIQPAAATQTIRVLPRYAATPWTWNSLTPDFELPADVTTRESIDWVQKAAYNRVYVSGIEQGVLGEVTRAGTGGNLIAPMVTDPLVTDTIAARQRGISILSNTGRIANVNLRLPVLPETGVITPGKFIKYVDGGVSRLGVVRSTSIEVGTPEIFQSIGVETHVS